MAGYSYVAAGAFTSALAGGNMSPAMPSFSAGNLLLLQTGVNSVSLGAPSITGWTKLTTNGTAPCECLYGRIAVAGDTSPTFQWDGSHQAFARIASFGGDVYTDLTTIVSVESERATNASGKIAVAATAAPSQSNCMVIRGGHCLKTSTNNGSSFADWITDHGIYSLINSTQLVQSGTAMAAALWYATQTSPASTSSDTAALTNTDTSANTQGFTVVLQPLAAARSQSRSLLGVGV